MNRQDAVDGWAMTINAAVVACNLQQATTDQIMRLPTLAAVACCGAMAVSSSTFAQDSAQNGSKAVAAGSEAMKDVGASGLQTAASVAVLPASVAATGSVVAGASATAGGRALIDSGTDTSKAANDSAAFATTPLPVTKTVITAQPAPSVPYAAQTPAPHP